MRIQARPAPLAALLVAATAAQEGGWGGLPEAPVAGRAHFEAPRLFGNVQGRVLDGWGSPATGIPVALSHSGGAFATVTDSVGTFLFAGIPLSGESDSADVVVEDGAWPSARVAVPPGALLAPRLLFLPGSWSLAGDAPPIAVPASAARSAASAWSGPWSVFATREGLTGFTTANGHVILQSDHFVALPSRRALNTSDSSREFLVELANGTSSVRVPVFDVGPWNTKDDWWHDTLRESFADLPRGTPEAMAAFRDGYNGGLDGSGRKVLNGAGVDLADGVFWNDLGMVNNGIIQVRLLWKLEAAKGDRVRLQQWANVRDSAGGKLVFKALCGESGTVAGAPRGGYAGTKWYLYWPVAWDRGRFGWVVENYLTRDTAAVACSDAAARLELRSGRLRADSRGVRARLEIPARVEFEVVSADGRILSRRAVDLGAGESLLELPRAGGVEFVRARFDGAIHVARRMP